MSENLDNFIPLDTVKKIADNSSEDEIERVFQTNVVQNLRKEWTNKNDPLYEMTKADYVADFKPNEDEEEDSGYNSSGDPEYTKVFIERSKIAAFYNVLKELGCDMTEADISEFFKKHYSPGGKSYDVYDYKKFKSFILEKFDIVVDQKELLDKFNSKQPLTPFEEIKLARLKLLGSLDAVDDIEKMNIFYNNLILTTQEKIRKEVIRDEKDSSKKYQAVTKEDKILSALVSVFKQPAAYLPLAIAVALAFPLIGFPLFLALLFRKGSPAGVYHAPKNIAHFRRGVPVWQEQKKKEDDKKAKFLINEKDKPHFKITDDNEPHFKITDDNKAKFIISSEKDKPYFQIAKEDKPYFQINDKSGADSKIAAERARFKIIGRDGAHFEIIEEQPFNFERNTDAKKLKEAIEGLAAVGGLTQTQNDILNCMTNMVNNLDDNDYKELEDARTLTKAVDIMQRKMNSLVGEDKIKELNDNLIKEARGKTGILKNLSMHSIIKNMAASLRADEIQKDNDGPALVPPMRI